MLAITPNKDNREAAIGHARTSRQDAAPLTVAGQQMRTSYLRPSSRSCRRYHDSRPRGAGLEGNCTGSCVGRMVCDGDRRCSRRVSKLGRTLGRTTGRGPRKMVFSTLALTVQTCVTMQSSPARTRMFGVQQGELVDVQVKEASFSRGPAQSHWAVGAFVVPWWFWRVVEEQAAAFEHSSRHGPRACLSVKVRQNMSPRLHPKVNIRSTTTRSPHSHCDPDPQERIQTPQFLPL